MVKGDQPGPNIDSTVFLEDLSISCSGLDTSACLTGLLLQQLSITTPVRRLTARLLRQQFSFTYPIQIFDCDKSITTNIHDLRLLQQQLFIVRLTRLPVGNSGLDCLDGKFFIGLIRTVLTSQAALPTYFNIGYIGWPLPKPQLRPPRGEILFSGLVTWSCRAGVFD